MSTVNSIKLFCFCDQKIEIIPQKTELSLLKISLLGYCWEPRVNMTIGKKLVDTCFKLNLLSCEIVTHSTKHFMTPFCVNIRITYVMKFITHNVLSPVWQESNKDSAL